MNDDTSREFTQKARNHARAKAFEAAGEYYAVAAYTTFGTDVPEYFEHLSPGLISLLKASLCYRLAANNERAAIQAKHGILFVEEARDTVATANVEEGLTFEYEGDFAIIGGLDGGIEAYNKARKNIKYTNRAAPLENVSDNYQKSRFTPIHAFSESWFRQRKKINPI